MPTFEGILLTILFIIPGVLAAKAESVIVPKSEVTDAKLAINSITYSSIINIFSFLLFIAFYYKCYCKVFPLMDIINGNIFNTDDITKYIAIFLLFWLVICILSIIFGAFWGRYKENLKLLIFRLLKISSPYHADKTIWKEILDRCPKGNVIEVTFYVNVENNLLCYRGQLAGFDPLESGENDTFMYFRRVRLYDKEQKKFIYIVDAYKGLVINTSNVLNYQINYRKKDDYDDTNIIWKRHPELSLIFNDKPT